MSSEHNHLNLISRMAVMFALAMAVCVAFSGCGMKSKGEKKIAQAVTQVKLLDRALDQYKLEVGTYPSDLQGLVTNVDQSEKWDGPYLKPPKVPLDPWGNEYRYSFPGEHNRSENGFGGFDLWSYGADGTEGGEGENADIANW